VKVIAKPNSVPVIHVVVALCANKYQGIVPVPARIGNGDDLVDNLYWGADYGVKTYFRHSRDWKFLETTKNLSPTILERVVFRHSATGAIMVADAYRGREIRTATQDFIDFSSGMNTSSIRAGEKTLSIGGGADMIVYVGHNGLMDFRLPNPAPPLGGVAKKVAILCCKSKQFFEPAMKASGARSLLWTKSLMAPEAYVVEAAIQSFSKHENVFQSAERASIAYAKYQHCSLRAARTVFVAKD
jgi:hypothetical protein